MKKALIIALLLSASSGHAQDVHFSQFFLSPLFQNPAHTGQFDADYRFVFNQRTQWRSITEPYNTWALAADAKDVMGKENIHAGILLFRDAAGDSPLRTIRVMPSGAHTFAATDDSTAFITLGLQVGFTQKYLDFSRLRFDNQYNGQVFDPSAATGESFSNDKSTYLDANIGATVKHELSRDIFYTAGMALFHVNRPKESFLNDAAVKLDQRFVIHGIGTYRFDRTWSALPAVQFQMQGKYRELIVGGMVRRSIIEKYGLKRALYVGAFGRTRDAAYLVTALDYDQWKVGVSYDINLSDLKTASRSRGGFEFSVAYIMNYFKSVYEEHRFCPDFL
ncbi:MAG: PorP/SprF family type IX secretion system membrane protein [Flavobacteriales bacterium]|nr:PorP/SprF family type IX secretion system membrane protein [Flavobacteriales bacterium]